MTKIDKISESANDSLQISAQECETFKFENCPNITLKVKKRKNGSYIFLFKHNGVTNVYNIYEMLSIAYNFIDNRDDCHKVIKFLDRFAIDNSFYWYLRDSVMIANHAIEALNKNSNIFLRQKTYLIKDNRTGATKIGKSNNPYKREKTLQSEVLSLELLYICDDNIESLLHKKYKDKRIRGEWFNLTDKDIEYIVNKYNFRKAEKI